MSFKKLRPSNIWSAKVNFLHSFMYIVCTLRVDEDFCESLYLCCVYFSNKPNPAAINNKINGIDGQVSGRACESCYGKIIYVILMDANVLIGPVLPQATGFPNQNI